LYHILVERPEEKRPLGRLWRRLADDIKMDLKYDVRVWIGFVWFMMRYTDGLL
jgi:hypothetical protein